ncbi:MerR family transcriptional regulator [Thermodesulfobacterium hydrogeniphilum]|uniref:MerR family transcriptional regulator n=1 Tax=Thermodesulfobacterium hydrogeniphilum TaxID=161156 RepID=UPI000571AA22|nr:MerR family transcriptional regulator [Thermodesulfobacterium hydrogeniphilum]
MKRVKNKDESLYVPLSEVAKNLNVKPHILYYWEKKFPQLKPYKIAQRKFYKKEQIKLLQTIKKMLEEGYTLDGIKKILQTQNLISKKPVLYQASFFEENLKKILKEVLKELKEIYKNL